MTTRTFQHPETSEREQLRCPICANDAVVPFWEMSGLPVRCNVLCATRQDALEVPRGDIRLAVCEGCGFIWNAAFDAERMAYDPEYENSLHFSAKFQEYAERLADRLIREYDLHGKDIIEIACGQGDFLRLLCARGDNRGLGFDPSFRGGGGTVDGSLVSIVRDYYGERYADRQADLICCRHALEHIPDPLGFLRSVRRAIGNRETAVFFEVPDVMYTLRDLGIWDIIYEHCGYFSEPSLRECFSRAGFEVLKTTEEYAGQFLTVEARPSSDQSHGPAGDGAKHVVEAARAFRRRFEEKLAEWTGQFGEMQRLNQRAVVWGAGSKGVTILNMLKATADLEPVGYVVDINPRKQGKFVAGTGQRIVGPEWLKEFKPDVVVVMNAIYAEEIQGTLDGLGLTSALWTV